MSRTHLMQKVMLGLAVTLASCNLFTGENQDAVNADVLGLQALIPAVSSAQTLGVPDDATLPAGSGIQAVTEAQVGLVDPAALATATYDTGNGYWRFPSTDVTDFEDGLYGVSSNSWALELRSVSDGWGDYQVTLYVYPTLSTAIHYTTEVYRVDADSWSIVANGSDIFEELTSIYFDGREETRTPFSVSGFGGDIWDTGYFMMPDDLDNPAYDYPATIVDPSADSNPVAGSYAIGVTGSIEYANNLSGYAWDIEAEYYREVPVTGGVEKYTKSYDSMTWTSGNYDIALNTVRIAFEDADGSQEQRSKTAYEVEYSYRGQSSSYAMEMHNVVERGDGTFTDTTEMLNLANPNNPVKTYTATVALTEDDTGEYSGTMTYAYQNGREVAWNYALTRSSGLSMQSRVNNARVSFNNGRVSSDAAVAGAGYGIAAGAVDPERVITVDEMDNGGSFAGVYTGGALVGVYTSANGNDFDIEVTPGTATVDGRAIDVADADL